MTTNPVGKGTKTVGINMSMKMANELEKRSSWWVRKLIGSEFACK